MSSPQAHPTSVGDARRTATSPLRGLLAEVDGLLDKLCDAESVWASWLDSVALEHLASARNLVHYWAIRQVDLRGLQARLAIHGLSSLGRSEAHVQATLLAVRSAVLAMLDDQWRPPPPAAMEIAEANELLRRRTARLLGPQPDRRITRIMVTLPSESAADAGLVADLVGRGMNIARINCAHDDADAWRAMARHVRQAALATGASCLVAVDLGGPKLRTGPLQPGPRCVKLRPRRNSLGQVVAPARAWLTAAEDPADAPQPGLVSVPVPRRWLTRRRPGEKLCLRDTRGSKRRLVVEPGLRQDDTTGFVVTSTKTTYLATGTVLRAQGSDDVAGVGELPTTEHCLVLHRGDVLELTRDCSPAPVDNQLGPPRIGCTLPQVFDHARPGHFIHFDDGRISGRVVSVHPDVLTVHVDRPLMGEARLKGGKGINMPDTDLAISAITDRDVADLTAAVGLADLVEMSFVRSPADVERLLAELDRLDATDMGIVLKIETRQAFEQLPQLLLTAMRRPRVGVMIARGDLAVECGYERMAELQEEILWLCEAAHLPVIWATQVLEQLAKTGLPARAEISDAAMSERAECAMLNKGPYIKDAVTVLDSILSRMREHHYKKNELLRPLRSWRADEAE